MRFVKELCESSFINSVKSRKIIILAFLLGLSAELSAAGTVYTCAFAPNGWCKTDWTLVNRPDLKQGGGWTQRGDCIENDNLTYTSMVYNNKFKGDSVISCTMSFLDSMAPLIVITPKFTENKEKRMEYQEVFEIVLYDKGINVWHLVFKDGKAPFIRTAFFEFPLEKNKKYKLSVAKTGKELNINVGEHTFGYLDKDLPEDYFVGITGCEGINRFYDFNITQ